MSKYEVQFSNRFKKAYKKAIKRGKDISKLEKVVALLADGETLPVQYKNHSLSGNYEGFKECHIEPDWLLVYRYLDNVLILELFDTGSHTDLFY
ncbi:MAG: type II toxin-antitoxin system YafQ family toxin [Spirochaetaceae bacterium]|nr:type II toxin-antitoxin system YafQ family toxin [Spirochaetaceae bacterium]MBO4728136.1 type II toxin-antitoxin system YafQ family toxin [Spirochaetaceae bacterium]